MENIDIRIRPTNDVNNKKILFAEERRDQFVSLSFYEAEEEKVLCNQRRWTERTGDYVK